VIFPGDQARGLQFGDPERDVEAVLYRIQQLVAEDKLDFHVGILFHELRDRGSQPERTVGHRGIDAERAAGGGLRLRDRLVGGV